MPDIKKNNLQPFSRNIIKGSVAQVTAKGFAVISNLVLTFFLVGYLSREEFGLWSLALGFILYVIFFDFGISSSLRNKIAGLDPQALEKNPGLEYRYFFSSFNFMLIVACCIVVLLLLLNFFFNFGLVVNSADPGLINTGRTTILLVLLFTVIKLPFDQATALLFAYQQSHIEAILNIINSVVSIAVIVFLIYLQASFTVLILAKMAAVLALPLSAFVYLLIKKRLPWKKYALFIDWRLLKKLIKSGKYFFVSAFLAFILLSTDGFIVNVISGIEKTGDYNLFRKLFELIVIFHFVMLNPLWSAYTRAAAEKNLKWCKDTLKRSLYLTIGISVFFGLALMLFSNDLIRLWVGRVYENNLDVRLAFFIWALLYTLGVSYSIFLNGLGKIRVQTLVMLAAAVINLPLAFLWGYWWGMAGVVLAGALGLLPRVIILHFVSFRYFGGR